MYVLILGLDVLGNPFGFIRGLSEGVEAFFYEPYQVKISSGFLWNVAKTARYKLYWKFGYTNNFYGFKVRCRIEKIKVKVTGKVTEKFKWHKNKLFTLIHNWLFLTILTVDKYCLNELSRDLICSLLNIYVTIKT